MPAVLLTANKFSKDVIQTRKVELLEAHIRLAMQLDALHVTETKSGHHIHVEQPQLVTEAIRAVVDAVRTEKQRITR